MKKIVIATGNSDKLREIKRIWTGLPLDISWTGEYPELEDVEETGNSLKENAALKAAYVSRFLNLPAVSDDTGLFVDYLNGSPGVYSSRYAGENASYSDNAEKLLKEMKGAPRRERTARFICTVCLKVPGKEPLFTEGVVEGFITEEPVGSGGFGYDPVFEAAGAGRTFALMSLDDKNALSHRRIAFEKMGVIIKESGGALF